MTSESKTKHILSQQQIAVLLESHKAQENDLIVLNQQIDGYQEQITAWQQQVQDLLTENQTLRGLVNKQSALINSQNEQLASLLNHLEY